MTENELNKLIDEFGLERCQSMMRLYDGKYPIGNYYIQSDTVRKIEFWQSTISTLYYKTARKEVIRQIERIKKIKLRQKLSKINEDF